MFFLYLEELSEPSEAVTSNRSENNSDCSTSESLGEDFYNDLMGLEDRFTNMTSHLINVTEEQ